MAIPSVFSVPFNIGFLSMQRATPTVEGNNAPPQFPLTAVLIGLVFLFLFWLLYCLAIGATTYAVSEAYLGREATVRGSYGRVRKRIWRILDVVLSVLVRMGGMFALAGVAVVALVAVPSILARSQMQRPAVALTLGILFLVAYLGVIGFVAVWSMRY